MDSRTRYPLPPVVAPDGPAHADPAYSSIEPAADWKAGGDFTDIRYEQEGRNAYTEGRRPEFEKFPKRP